jgi:predicted RNase H-like HicB family nuclease
MNIGGYKVEVQKLSSALGGGFVAFAPELMGCIADGESRAVALLNLEDAIECWVEGARATGRPVPQPNFASA